MVVTYTETRRRKSKAPTIADATGKTGINRRTADRIIDPQGYFERNKKHNFGESVLHELQRILDAKSR